ncbi:MAG: NAD-dependent epimerase/dehydratase family protein, partial [bacterium]|nr:NAD-dependent epimerase/dehydratase family protein [bacterium]
MATHLILGAGPIGSSLAAELAARGEDVAVATRSGTQLPGVRAITLDAADAGALTAAAEGARTIYVCTNPPYHRWPTQWPPIVEAVIAAARATGAGVVMTGNLYAYGRPGGAMTPESAERPTESKGSTRAEMWQRLKSAHDAGEIRAAEVRASDYFGPGTGTTNHLGSGFFTAVMSGKPAQIVGNPSVPHAWAYAPDIARALAAVGTRDDLWGRIWFAPHVAQLPAQEMADRIAQLAGAPTPARVRQYPGWLVTVLAWFMPALREVRKVAYQHTEPYLVDDSASRAALGVEPTPLAEALAAT